MRTAFIVWSVLALAGWLLLLLPAYLLVDRAPAVMHVLFGGTGAPAAMVAGPGDSLTPTAAEIEALGKIAPAAGGNASGATN